MSQKLGSWAAHNADDEDAKEDKKQNAISIWKWKTLNHKRRSMGTAMSSKSFMTTSLWLTGESQPIILSVMPYTHANHELLLGLHTWGGERGSWIRKTLVWSPSNCTRLWISVVFDTCDGRCDGFDCACSVSSSGRTVFNDNMSRFLNVPLTFPQKVAGMKLVQNQLVGYRFYISPWTAFLDVCHIILHLHFIVLGWTWVL